MSTQLMLLLAAVVGWALVLIGFGLYLKFRKPTTVVHKTPYRDVLRKRFTKTKPPKPRVQRAARKGGDNRRPFQKKN